jgi:hypothetical protein
MPERRYFLDWLRVLAFAGLAAFHVGLLYATWDYNLKSPVLYPAVEWLLEALIPWRMALLFVISGVACRFLVAKLGPVGFARNRLGRLLPVILTGMLLINPIQAWVQLLAHGATHKDYLDFWLTAYLRSDRAAMAALGRPMPTWDHLWFLVYLVPYSLIVASAALIAPIIRRPTLPLALLLVAPGLWMTGTNVLVGIVAPETHALINDWAAHLKWFGLFCAGAVLALREDAWAFLMAYRRALVAAAAVLLAGLLACRSVLVGGEQGLTWGIAYRIVQGAYGWAAVLAITGFGAQWLNAPSRSLRYLNEAVLPVYVLHQPALLTAAYLLFPFRLPVFIEASLLLFAAALLPLGVYHLAIRPYRPVRRLFGVRSAVPKPLVRSYAESSA